VAFSARAAGSYAPASTSETLRADLAPLPWSWLSQVHGATCHKVTAAGDHAGDSGDGLVTAQLDCVLAVQVADCAPVAFLGAAAVGVAHAGWTGLEAGVLESTVEAVRDLDSGTITAVVGPHIGTGCYEFGSTDLDRLSDRFGAQVRGVTRAGTPALDLGAVVRSELDRLAIDEIVELGACTSCEPERFFSHRARRDIGRHAMVAWMEAKS
jgi:YfiH family protein